MGALDSNPKTIAAILLALGVFGIGGVLTFGFFNDSTLLGVGVTMIVLGAAGLLLGIINLCAQDQSGRKKAQEQPIAPPRVPDVIPRVRGKDLEDDPDAALYYEPCSVSPKRDRSFALEMTSPNREGSTIVPIGGGVAGASMLSPYDQRSFPVPVIGQGNTPGKVVIESYSMGHTHDYDDGRSQSAMSNAFRTRLTNRLEPPHPAESKFKAAGGVVGSAGQENGGLMGSPTVGAQVRNPVGQQRYEPSPRPAMNQPQGTHQPGSPAPMMRESSYNNRAPDFPVIPQQSVGGAGRLSGQGPPPPPLPSSATDRYISGPSRPLPMDNGPGYGVHRRFTDGSTPNRNAGGDSRYYGEDDDALSPRPASHRGWSPNSDDRYH